MSKKILIVGGVAAGASTAARLRRLDEEAEIVILEKGEYISFANCGLPYYVGGVIERRDELLVQTPQSMYARFRIDVRIKNEATKILREEKQVEIYNHLTDETYRENYDYLVLCPGSDPIVPPIEGVNAPNVFTVRNIPDSDMIKQYIYSQNPAHATVIGAGFIGLEMLEMLYGMGLKVSLVEASPQVIKPLDPDMASIVHYYLRQAGIDLKLNTAAQRFIGSGRVEKIILNNGELATDMVIMGVGVRPATALAAAADLEIGKTGGILVDEYLRTSDSYIYAAGDAVQVKNYITGQDTLVPLAGPANRQGWLIANNICGRSLPYKGVQGSSILKIGDLTVAVTGNNEYALNIANQPYLAVHTSPFSHATYYPGATQMHIKLLFDPDQGRILGAQIVGRDGVDKRIDVIATAIRAGLTVYDLQDLELAYAPPFSSAKDPVNLTAYAAANILNGDVEVVHWNEVDELLSNGAFLLDTRTQMEVKAGKVPYSYHIPVDNLRERISELPRDKDILVYCRTGLRSYIAARILKQSGYKAKNISGGYIMYQYINSDR